MKTQLVELISQYPAVALLGPRQVGKTTLAIDVAATRPSIYLDLESPGDQAKLTEPELYLAEHEDKLVILDEVHRRPNIFQTLRGLIDKGRRRGTRDGAVPAVGLGLGRAAQAVRRDPGRSCFLCGADPVRRPGIRGREHRSAYGCAADFRDRSWRKMT